MRLVSSSGNPELAMVHVGEDDRGRRFEFVDSVQPPRPRSEKWVVIVSTMFGCPVMCAMCDAGGRSEGTISAEGMLWQVRTAVRERFGSDRPRTDMLKVQFARMGDPTLNPAVLEAIEALPSEFPRTRVVASLSTIAPKGAARFLAHLKIVKDRRFGGGDFQLQFSIHSTDPAAKRRLCPSPTMSLREMASQGTAFRSYGDKKVTLNFCLIEGVPFDPVVVRDVFDPEHFLVKLTPLNPTRSSARRGLKSLIGPGTESRADPIIASFREQGFETILSIGSYEENQIGSNCGLYLGSLEDR